MCDTKQLQKGFGLKALSSIQSHRGKIIRFKFSIVPGYIKEKNVLSVHLCSKNHPDTHTTTLFNRG